MFYPLPLFIGLRYSQAKRRNQFISFVSLISLLGMILGVFALIVVLSVMNGFEAELRERVLSVVPHGLVSGPAGKLDDWEVLATDLTARKDIVAVAPYVAGNVMLSHAGIIRGAQLSAILPEQEMSVSQIDQRMFAGSMGDLRDGSFNMVLGNLLARQLGVEKGDSVTVVLPRVTLTPLGVFPRTKRFTVSGTFGVGSQIDGQVAFIHLHDGQRLFQLGDSVSGLRVKVDDLFAAPGIMQRVKTDMAADTSPADPKHSLSVKSWRETQGSLFQSVAMEKRMIGLLLLIIIAVAAFNIVSILIMMVSDKRSDIAVLRTMGASPAQVTACFMVQGLSVGLVGITVGILLGLPVAYSVGDIVLWFEQLFGVHVFDPQVYFISRIPSVVKAGDVLLVLISGVVLTLLATIYPAWRAAQVHPAEVLRYE